MTDAGITSSSKQLLPSSRTTLSHVSWSRNIKEFLEFSINQITEITSFIARQSCLAFFPSPANSYYRRWKKINEIINFKRTATSKRRLIQLNQSNVNELKQSDDRRLKKWTETEREIINYKLMSLMSIGLQWFTLCIRVCIHSWLKSQTFATLININQYNIYTNRDSNLFSDRSAGRQ